MLKPCDFCSDRQIWANHPDPLHGVKVSIIKYYDAMGEEVISMSLQLTITALRSCMIKPVWQHQTGQLANS